MTRAIRLITSAIVITFGARVAAAQSVLLQPRPGEVKIDPFSLEQVISGVPLSVRVHPFLLARPVDDQLRMDARALADLSELQSKIGDLVDTIPLPVENVRIWGKEIAVDGNIAKLTLKGDAFIDLVLITITQPFTATLPFTLEVVNSHTVALKTHDPSVRLSGSLGDLSDQLLKFVGVDIKGRLREALNHALGPDLLKKSVPEDLLWLNPVISKAEFLNNSGTLVASLEMNAALDGKVLLKFIQAVTNHSHDDQ